MHGGLREVLDALSQPQVQQLLSTIVRMQAIVGVEAAVEEGECTPAVSEGDLQA